MKIKYFGELETAKKLQSIHLLILRVYGDKYPMDGLGAMEST